MVVWKDCFPVPETRVRGFRVLLGFLIQGNLIPRIHRSAVAALDGASLVWWAWGWHEFSLCDWFSCVSVGAWVSITCFLLCQEGTPPRCGSLSPPQNQCLPKVLAARTFLVVSFRFLSIHCSWSARSQTCPHSFCIWGATLFGGMDFTCAGHCSLLGLHWLLL